MLPPAQGGGAVDGSAVLLAAGAVQKPLETRAKWQKEHASGMLQRRQFVFKKAKGAWQMLRIVLALDPSEFDTSRSSITFHIDARTTAAQLKLKVCAC